MSVIKDRFNNIFQKLFNFVITLYQKILSPILPARCRYYPTCSEYGKQALAWYGPWSGSWLLLKRLSRCHPLGGHGIDFVPLPLFSYGYRYLPTPLLSQGLGVWRDDISYVARLNSLIIKS
ncbi:membrane protein insertion efficiency factor YidD [Psychrobacter sp. DM4]|uniref:membrane protein insertion efficiency factor YidD n=1 Tax=Psychrobacter sp. DM4 TaxID=3440637 RepID=UPI003F4FDE74